MCIKQEREEITMRNIVLVCAAGMSTSLLVKKMREAATAEGYECEIHAYALANLVEKGPGADIILLGPQVRYQLDAVKKQFPDKPVDTINMADYGMMNGKNVIGAVKKALGD